MTVWKVVLPEQPTIWAGKRMDMYDKKLERNIIWALAIILIFIGLIGCQSINKKPIKQPLTLTDSVTIMKDLGTVLGCVFVPEEPVCVKENKDNE
jgi:hypothetical protein